MSPLASPARQAISRQLLERVCVRLAQQESTYQVKATAKSLIVLHATQTLSLLEVLLRASLQSLYASSSSAWVLFAL